MGKNAHEVLEATNKLPTIQYPQLTTRKHWFHLNTHTRSDMTKYQFVQNDVFNRTWTKRCFIRTQRCFIKTLTVWRYYKRRKKSYNPICWLTFRQNVLKFFLSRFSDNETLLFQLFKSLKLKLNSITFSRFSDNETFKLLKLFKLTEFCLEIPKKTTFHQNETKSRFD